LLYAEFRARLHGGPPAQGISQQAAPGNEGQLPSEHIAQGLPLTVLANHFPVLIVLQWNFSRPITYEIIGGKSDVI